MKWAQKQTGFTIVELLIVVVVIAILATITIVSYNGVTARAKYVQQIAAIDKVGKAIQLYIAEKGHGLDLSGSGYNGQGYGGFTSTTVSNGANYTSVSIDQLLRNGGYLSGSIEPLVASQILISPCTSISDPRRVVYATVEGAPLKPVADQISATNCSTSYLTLYTGGSYSRNLLKAY